MAFEAVAFSSKWSWAIYISSKHGLVHINSRSVGTGNSVKLFHLSDLGDLVEITHDLLLYAVELV